jgi:hypothetical protein
LYIWDTDNKVWVNYKELVETEQLKWENLI